MGPRIASGKGKLISRGEYGKVFRLQEGNNIFAVKDYVDLNGCIDLIEIDIMSRLNHPNITSGTLLMRDGKPSLKMKLADGSLDKVSQGNTDKKLKLFRDILSGVQFLHKNNILHLDLKPNNILIYDDTAKITDFGLALTFDRCAQVKRYCHKRVTDGYRAPEITGDQKVYSYSKANDVWSLGIIFIDMFTKGIKLSDKDKEYNDNVVESALHNLEKDIIEMVKRMLDLNPNTRISINECLTIMGDKEIKVDSSGYVIQPIITGKESVDKDDYSAFYFCYRFALEYRLLTETVFLAIDLYHRCLPYLKKGLTPRSSKILCMSSALLTSINLIESNRWTKEIIRDNGCNHSFEELIEAQSYYINILNGILYRFNPFTSVKTESSLIAYFDHSRNHEIYKRFNFGLSEKSEVRTKYFTEFFPKTETYKWLTQRVGVPLRYNNFNLIGHDIVSQHLQEESVDE